MQLHLPRHPFSHSSYSSGLRHKSLQFSGATHFQTSEDGMSMAVWNAIKTLVHCPLDTVCVQGLLWRGWDGNAILNAIPALVHSPLDMLHKGCSCGRMAAMTYPS